MNETEFISLAGRTLSHIEHALENAGLDFEQPADGILEIEFDDGSKIVINRHAAAREIWVAARAGGFHFRHDGSAWLDTRDQADLFSRLTELIHAQGGEDVDFSTAS